MAYKLRLKSLFNRLLKKDAGKHDIVLPKDSTPLTDIEYEKAIDICDWVTAAVQNRDSYIKKHNLDYDVNNPGANWALTNSFFDGYRAVISKKYENINYLRVFSQVFSGNYLGVKHAAGMRVPREIPKSLNDDVEKHLLQEDAWWLQKYLTLLEYAPGIKEITPPQAFGESGFRVDGVLVNHDVYVYLERLSLLVKSGIIQRLRAIPNPVILEIGSGYGALAHFIKTLIPGCRYICVDIPESLIFAAIYLTRFHGAITVADVEQESSDWLTGNTVFVPNYMFHCLVDHSITVDLAINTLSMSEMTNDQIANYCIGLNSILSDQSIFFEQNQDNRSIGLSFAHDEISKYFRWSKAFDAEHGLTQGKVTLWATSSDSFQGLHL